MPINPVIIASKTCDVRINPIITISNNVVCITSDFENATPIANDLRVNKCIRIIVNKIWQMRAVTRKNHVFADRFLSITNSSIPKKKTVRRATKGRANINLE